MLYNDDDIRMIITKVAYDVRKYGFGGHSVASAFSLSWIGDNKRFLEKIKVKKRAVAGYTSIDVLGLNTRAFNIIAEINSSKWYYGDRHYNIPRPERIKTIQELCELSEFDILTKRNSGVVTLNHIKSKLSEIGWSLKKEE